MASTKNTKKRKTTSSKKTNKTTREKYTKKQLEVRNEIIILISLAVCVFLQLGLFGICGDIGDALAAVLFGTFGFMAYITPVLLFIAIAFLSQNKKNRQAYIKTGAIFGLFMICCTLFQIIIYGKTRTLTSYKAIYEMTSKNQDGGGVLGSFLIKTLQSSIGMVGIWLLMLLVCIVCFVLLTEKSFINVVKTEGEKAYQSAKEKAEIHREKRAQEKQEVKRTDKVVSGVSFDTTLTKEEPDIREITPPEPSDKLFKESKPERFTIKRSTPIDEKVDSINTEEYTQQVLPDAVLNKEDAVTRKRRSTIESIENAATEAENVEKQIKKSDMKPKKAYAFPPITLLTKGKASGGDSDSYLRETALKLEQTLQTFHVNATVTNVSCGPSVTRFELQPEMGVKVSKIVGLADDIKLNLAASDIRIEAPIPGKAAVGIEVPNRENIAVMLRDLLDTPEFKNHPSKLAFAGASNAIPTRFAPNS